MAPVLMTARRAMRAACTLWLLCAGACNFESVGSERAEVNTCTTQDQCSDGAECRGGMCMARATATPLHIALEVTPRRVPNANEPLPFLFDPLMVNQPLDLDFELPQVITVGGNIREANALLPASITFTPTTTIPGVSVKSVTAATTVGGLRKDFDYTVQLFEGVEYRMLVRPVDPHHPPFRRTFIAETDTDLSLEYSDLPKDERTFAVTGGPVGADVILSAFDRVTGEAISSTGLIAGGKTKLSFAADAERFRLEIRVAPGTLLATKAADAGCDASTPPFPIFNVLEDQLAVDPSGVTRIRLPDAPQRIRYEGTVELCGGDDIDPAVVGNLPIALRSTKLLMEQPPGLVASYNATTSASYDPGAREFRFCVGVLQGEYDIVVTPAASMHCALFAEHRLIKPPTDEANASGMQLLLPNPQYVMGALQTVETAPLKGAGVDGIALGRTGTVGFSDTDDRVTRFNRSQQTTSDGQGSFKLLVDFGSYDIVIKPPAGSGFPWQIRYDVEIGDQATTEVLPARISMVPPVALEGTLRSAGSAADSRLDGATIDAYALVSDGLDGRRAINIGKTTANADRHFLLLLPPSTQMHWDSALGAH